MIISRPCDYCQESYNADTRYLNRGQGQYCSRSCSSKSKVSKLKPKPNNVICAYCEKPFYLTELRQSKSKSGLFFCSKEHQNEGYRSNILKPGRKESERSVRHCIQCDKIYQGEYETCKNCSKDLIVQAWLNGDNSVTLTLGETKDTKRFVKEHLIATRGDKCAMCDWDKKAPDGRSIIQMDHIDGNSTNNLIENLRLLCPNHHAMTPNYGSLNKGSGRAHRRKYG